MAYGDDYHLERCSGLRCRVLALRSEMIKKPAPGRGWYCQKCWIFYEKILKKPDERAKKITQKTLFDT